MVNLYVWRWVLTNTYYNGKRYTFHSFLALKSTHIASEGPNLMHTFILMLIVKILRYADWWHNCSVFCTCEGELLTSTDGKWYIFNSFLGFKYKYIISEVLNLISTFILKVKVIILSFVDWWHGWSVRVKVHELLTSTCGKWYTFHSFLALKIYTHSLKLWIWSAPLSWC